MGRDALRVNALRSSREQRQCIYPWAREHRTFDEGRMKKEVRADVRASVVKSFFGVEIAPFPSRAP